MIVPPLLDKIAPMNLIKTLKLFPKIAQMDFSSSFFAILGGNYTVLSFFFLANLSKVRRVTIDCQLNSLLENC